MKEKILPPIHPNIGIEKEYARKLEALVDAMHKSIMWYVTQAYKGSPPQTILAMDDSTTIKLDKVIKKLARYWHKRYSEAAKDLANYFANKNKQQTDANLQYILQQSGFSVNFTLTPVMREVLQATIRENVSLITKMSQQHLDNINGIVMRSVAMGGDVGYVVDALQNQYGMTRRRARLIALDQNSKATAAIVRVRQHEVGIKEAKWLHSHGGKEPRPTHVAMDGKKYDVVKGMWDEHAQWEKGVGWVGDWVHPGELINCRCVSRSVVPALGLAK